VGYMAASFDTSHLSDCFWNAGATGTLLPPVGNISSGIAHCYGKDPAELMQQATFTSWLEEQGGTPWDFVHTWGIVEGGTFPYLLAETGITVEQADGQPDPCNHLNIFFDVTLQERLPGLSAAHFVNDGTATGVQFNLASSDPLHYTLTAAIATTDGTISPRLPAGVLFTESGELNPQSSGQDGTVTLDREEPVITIAGDSFQVVSCGEEFAFPEIYAIDTLDGEIAILLLSPFPDTTTPGPYAPQFRAMDAAGNVRIETLYVYVADIDPPVLILVGDAVLPVPCLGVFQDPGAIAIDTCAGDLPVVTSGTVNTAVPGDYILTYSAEDTVGNTASVTRTVTVTDLEPPVLTLAGDAAMRLVCGDTFNDPGATAQDTCAGELPVVVEGAVNTAIPGTYTLTYRAEDTAGNTASVTRQVEVRCDCLLEAA